MFHADSVQENLLGTEWLQGKMSVWSETTKIVLEVNISGLLEHHVSIRLQFVLLVSAYYSLVIDCGSETS